MVKVGLITEGITDQFILKPIISNFSKEEEFRFNEIQPRIDETDRQEGFGGWVNVLRTCQEEDFDTFFMFNDFVVIQIDSDVSQEIGFDVPHFQNGKQLSDEELCDEIIAKLKSLIPAEILSDHLGKFLFAVGIHSSECWLLTLYEDSKLKIKTRNCIENLNRELARQNSDTINPKDKNNAKGRGVYQSLSKGFKNRKIILKSASNNAGLNSFVRQLSGLSLINQ